MGKIHYQSVLYDSTSNLPLLRMIKLDSLLHLLFLHSRSMPLFLHSRSTPLFLTFYSPGSMPLFLQCRSTHVFLHYMSSPVSTHQVYAGGGAGKARTVRYLIMKATFIICILSVLAMSFNSIVRYLLFTLICVFTIVIVSLYIPGVYFLNTFHQTFHFQVCKSNISYNLE